MEALSGPSPLSTALRPVQALQADLSAVLAEGRVVAGQVLSTWDGGSVLIGIAGQRVPAETQVELRPGQRFLARVEIGPEGVLLHVLEAAPAEETPLVRALRSVLGFHRPAGERLEELARAFAGASSEGPAGALQRALGELAWTPEADGRALRALLERSGLRFEASLAAAAGAAAGGALRRSAGSRPPADPARGRDGSPPAPGVQGGRDEPAPQEAERREPAAEAARAALDLKGRLLRLAADERARPAEREAAARGAAGIEAEQLLHLARRESGEPARFSVPVPDAGGWATATFGPRGAARETSDRELSPESSGEAGDPLRQLVLEVELEHLGPVHVELSLRAGALALRVAVERPAVVERVRAALAEGTLAADAASPLARLAVVCEVPRGRAGQDAAAERGRLDATGDLRWLREHPLVDLSG